MKTSLGTTLRSYALQYAKDRGAEIEGELGEGGSAAVYRMARGASILALKVYDPALFSEKNGAAERRRLELQRQLQGHTCSSLLGITSVEEVGDTCFLEMEFLPWRTLKDALTTVPDASIATLMSQLVDAVVFLESKGIVHRDIKPENILVDSESTQLKLIDLGVAREMYGDDDAVDATDHSGRRPFIATAQYSSPEYLFRIEPPSAELWRALTLYQLGGVLHDLVMKKPLFHTAVATGNKYNVAAAVLKQVPDFEGVPLTLRPLATTASRCLVKDGALRLKLVSLGSLLPISGTPVELLRQRVAQVATEQRAATDLERRALQHNIDRQRALEAIGEGIKTRLAELLAKKYHVRSYAESAQLLTVSIALDANNSVGVRVNVEWDEVSNPLVGVAAMTAQLNGLEQENLSTRSIGEVDAANAGLTALIDAHFEVVCQAILAAQYIVEEHPGAVAKSRDLMAE